jgi:hypothetical protein
MGGSFSRGIFAGAKGGSRALADYILTQQALQEKRAAEGRAEARTIAGEVRKQRAATVQMSQSEYDNTTGKPAEQPKPLTKAQVEGQALAELFQSDPAAMRDYFLKKEKPPKVETPKTEKPPKPEYSKKDALNDALKFVPKQELTDEQNYANQNAAAKGLPLPYTIAPPSMIDVTAKAGSLYNKLNFGQWEAPQDDLLDDPEVAKMKKWLDNKENGVTQEAYDAFIEAKRTEKLISLSQPEKSGK